MQNRHKNFDEEKLFRRKNDLGGYRYCPLCSSTLVEALVDGHKRLKCPNDTCGFIFYQNPAPAAGVLLIREDRVLLVKRAHPPKVGWWCLPAGFMEWGEHPRETAVREVREETGLHVTLTSFFEVYSGSDDPRTNAVLLLYLAKETGGRLRAADDALEVRYFHLDDLPDEIAFESHRQALSDYDRRFRRAQS